MTTISTPPLYKVALYQTLILIFVGGFLALEDTVLAFSVLVGGFIQIGPQAWFARQAFKYTGARQVDKVVRAMYLGESGKIVLTASLFVACFVLWEQLNFLAVISTFIVMIPMQWFITAKVLRQ
ncbi:ATP synthase subunit I [Porticoccaceae bacterium]|nr:ATP synthase subunit I [Porticoccaceae bacterium]MDG2116516.1 ATP synthase subunit I [Porticoccaceae bacterium]